MPEGIQCSRVKGWRKPSGAVYVGRPSRWGNAHGWRAWPKANGSAGWAKGLAVDLFEVDLYAGRMPFTCKDVQRELRGKDLMCWCKVSEPCHRNVLLRVANF
jgi:hypothetical protein